MAKREHHDPLARPASAIDEEMRLTAPLFCQPFQPSTSAAAYADASEHFTEREQQILDIMTEHGAMALFQLAERLGVPDHTISGRVTALKTKRAIEVTGERVRTPRGSMADVYRITRSRQ